MTYNRPCECPEGTHVNDIITRTGEVRHQHDSPRWLTPAEQVSWADQFVSWVDDRRGW